MSISHIIALTLFVLGCVIPVNFVYADPATANVSITSGSSVPGCEESSSCFMPYEVTVDVGGKVTWSNDDSAAHTVTSGNSEIGPNGIFDSGMLMSGKPISFTFEDTGTYEYFCMVHPWMKGVVYVEERSSKSTVSVTVTTDKESYTEGETILISGKADRYIPGVPLYAGIIVDPVENVFAELLQIDLNPDNTYTTSTIARGDLYENGKYAIKIIKLGGGEDSPEIISEEAIFEFTSNPTTPQSGSTKHTNVYENEKYGFSIEYPSNWNVSEEELEYTDQTQLVNLFPSQETNFKINVDSNNLEFKNLGDQEYLDKMTMQDKEECKLISVDDYGFICKNFKPLISTTINDGKYPTYLVGYTYTQEYADGSIAEASNLISRIPDGDKDWIITVSSSVDDLPHYLGEIPPILNSFTISDYEEPDIRTPTLQNDSHVVNPDYGISYRMTGGEIREITPDISAKSLIIEIETTSKGKFTIILPRGLIDAKVNGEDDSFFVLVDGTESNFEESTTLEDRTLTIPFEDGNTQIEILGTFVEPNYVKPIQTKSQESEKLETNSDQKSGCLIATATYGSELAPQVQLLREIRDNVLFSTESGTTFMIAFNQFYYSFSPTVSDWERQSPLFKEVVKTTITPMLSTLSILNYVHTNSEQEVLGYGIGLILLNIGMYFVVPAIVIIQLKQKFKN